MSQSLKWMMLVGLLPQLCLAQMSAQSADNSTLSTGKEQPPQKTTVSVAGIEQKLLELTSQSNTFADGNVFSTFDTLKTTKSSTEISLIDDTVSPIGLDELAGVVLPAQQLINQHVVSEQTTPNQSTNTQTPQQEINYPKKISIQKQTQVSPADDIVLDPTKILPSYQEESFDTLARTPSFNDSLKKKPNLIKRVYNRFFNDGASSEHLSAKIFLVSAKSDTTTNLQTATANQVDTDGILVPLNDEEWQYESEFLANIDTYADNMVLTKADLSQEPFKNIKAALENISVDSLSTFSVSLPRLRETVKSAARAVGYYDTQFYLKNAGNGTVEVIISELGEPVLVASEVFVVRGDGEHLEEFKSLKRQSEQYIDTPFVHGDYENTKLKVDTLKTQKGFFEGRWLNSSADIVLPDNVADVNFVYDTGVRYDFDDVVFFTIDKETGALTTDPAKLPVRLPLLKKLLTFEKNDGFDQTKINKLSSDLLATRYFDKANVEAVLPEASQPVVDNNPKQENQTVIQDEEIEAVMLPIDFSAGEDLLAKLNQITAKAERLYNSPDDRVLDENPKKSTSLLGKVSDTVTNIVKKILPDESGDVLSALTDTETPLELVGKKTPQQVFDSKKVPLYVFVASDKPRDAKIGLGWGSDTGTRVTASLDNGLINNGGYQAGISTSISRTEKGLNSYISRPLSHPLDDKLIGNLKYYQEEISQTLPDVTLSSRTLETGVSRNMVKEDGWNKTYGIRYRLDELEANTPRDTWVDLPVQFNEGTPSQEALLAGISFSKFSQDSATAPTMGHRQSYSLEVGSKSLASSADMAILKASFGGMIGFGDNQYGKNRKHQLVGRVEAGYLWTDDLFAVPYKLRFFAGGDQSLRGYNYQSISPVSSKGYLMGGQSLAIASGEYSYEIQDGLRAAVFADVGGAYDKRFKGDTKLGVGVGVRYASPVGTVRVDIAKGIEKESTPIRLHFLIGLPF